MNTRIKKPLIIAALLLATTFSYAEGVSAVNNETFSKVLRIDWNLARVIRSSGIVIIDRTNAQREIYSIRFLADHLGGRGADNIFSSHYADGENNSLSIGKIASTRVNPIFQIEDFREYEYFRHLERVWRWDFHDWVLELRTYDEKGDEVTLEFIPIYK